MSTAATTPRPAFAGAPLRQIAGWVLVLLNVMSMPMAETGSAMDPKTDREELHLTDQYLFPLVEDNGDQRNRNPDCGSRLGAPVQLPNETM